MFSSLALLYIVYILYSTLIVIVVFYCDIYICDYLYLSLPKNLKKKKEKEKELKKQKMKALGKRDFLSTIVLVSSRDH